jgi:hypothetical protein
VKRRTLVVSTFKTPQTSIHRLCIMSPSPSSAGAASTQNDDDLEFGGGKPKARNTTTITKRRRLTSLKASIRNSLSNQLSIFTSKKHLRLRKQGELFTQIVFLVYVTSCVMLVGKENVENISACGYNSVVPWYVGILFYASATASNHSCLWYVVRSVRADENTRRATMRMVFGMISVVSLYLTMYFPRCFWQCHQTSVWMWAISTSALMTMRGEETEDAKKSSETRTKSSKNGSKADAREGGENEGDDDTTIAENNIGLKLLAQHHALTKPPVKMYLYPFLWFSGFLICVALYYENNYYFFFGESMASMAYSAWVMSKHLGSTEGGGGAGGEKSSGTSGSKLWPPRNYGLREYLCDASVGCFLYYLCEVINRPRMCPRGKIFAGPSLLPFFI